MFHVKRILAKMRGIMQENKISLTKSEFLYYIFY